MSSINFLPDSYIQQTQVARRRPVNLCAVVLTAAALAGAWLLGDRSEALADRAEHLQGQVAELEATRQHAEAIQREIAETRARHEVVREINQPVTASQVIAAISAVSPEAVKLTNLQVIAHRATPAPVPTGEDTPAPQADTEPNWLEVSLMGVAPDQATVNTLTRALSEHPLFTQVRPRSSGVTTAGLYQAREFLIVVRIDLDRTFVVPSQPEGPGHE